MTDFLPQPELAPPGVWSFPTPTRARLDNGIETVVFQLPGQHVVVGPPGAGHPAERGGPRDSRAWPRSAPGCWTRARRQHDGEEFAELLETEGAGFGIEVALAGLQAMLDVPVSHLEPALRAVRRGGARAVAGRAGRQPARPAAAGRDRAGPGQLGPGGEHRLPVARSSTRPSRASRMNGGEPETVGRVDQEARRRRSTPTISGRPGRPLILAGDFRTDPVALAERCFGGWRNPSQQAVVTAGPGADDRAGWC